MIKLYPFKNKNNRPQTKTIFVTCRTFKHNRCIRFINLNNINPEKMKSFVYLFGNRVFFSCWSRKGFALFAAMGKQVRINRLAIHMYKNVLLSSARHGVIINFSKVAEFFYNTDVVYSGYDPGIIGMACRSEEGSESKIKYFH